MTKLTNATSGPYGSARDLPSVAEMLQQLQGAKVLTRFIARSQRPKVLAIEKQLNELTDLVDRFYELLGPRNWIFHEQLDTSKIKALLHMHAVEAETELISIYQDRPTLDRLIRSVRRFPELRARIELIEKAQADYEGGRFYSTVLTLITVMDGFVNDLEPEHRRGLHARDADDLTAWDSVVGHHMGLAHAHKTFTKPTFKTSTEPVYELQRHGIVHGTLVNFDNVVVATKAWNRLFAVADWASSRQREAFEPEPEPTWRDVLGQISRNQRVRKALDEWQPSTLEAGDAGFAEHEMFERSMRYLAAWSRANYGAMAELVSPRIAKSTHAQTAGMIRSECELFPLESFEVKSLVFEAAAVCEVDVRLGFESDIRPGRMRWIREAEGGDPAMPNEDGTWFLFLWEPLSMLNRALGVASSE